MVEKRSIPALGMFRITIKKNETATGLSFHSMALTSMEVSTKLCMMDADFFVYSILNYNMV